MELYQMLTIIGANVVLAYHFGREMRDFRTIMHNETKDFHGRLIRLEERFLDLKKSETKK